MQPINSVAWSNRKSAIFRRCRTEFVFHAFLAGEGGDSGANSLARQAHLLKYLIKLENFPNYLALKALREFFYLSMPEEANGNQTAEEIPGEALSGRRLFARNVWHNYFAAKHAMALGEHQRDHRKPMLAELYYNGIGFNAAFGQLEKLIKNMLLQLENGTALDLLAEIPNEKKRHIENPLKVCCNGKTLYASPAANWYDAGGRLHYLLQNPAPAEIAICCYHAWLERRAELDKVRFWRISGGDLAAIDTAPVNLAQEVASINAELLQMERIFPGDLEFFGNGKPECSGCRFYELCSEGAEKLLPYLMTLQPERPPV